MYDSNKIIININSNDCLIPINRGGDAVKNEQEKILTKELCPPMVIQPGETISLNLSEMIRECILHGELKTKKWWEFWK